MGCVPCRDIDGQCIMIMFPRLDGISEWLHVRDDELRLVWATDVAREFFGWPMGPEPFDTKDGETLRLAAETARRQGRWMGSLVRTDCDGNKRQLESRWSLLKDVAGTRVGFVIFEYEIDERPVANEQLMRAQRMESIGTLAGGIAHDINNVLGPILLSAEMIRRRVTDPWVLKMAEAIETSAQRGARIVNQVLDFSQEAEGEHIAVQIRHIVREAVEFAQHTFSRQIKVEGSYPRDLPLIMVDPIQIRQAVLNLMVNARDAVTGRGSVSLSMESVRVDETEAASFFPEGRPGNFVRLSVSDNGLGIRAEYMERIFEPFFTTKKRGQGSGLGLSSTLAIVHSHRGFMTVTTEVGKGSCFSIFLPQVGTPVVPAPSGAEPGKAERSTRRHVILFVEDDPAMLQMNAEMLTSHGHEVVQARNGSAGLKAFTALRDSIDLVITDINMPDMDGPDMIREIRSIRQDTPFIAVSGLTEWAHFLEGNGLIGIDLLQKPYTVDQLLDAIEISMDRSADRGANTEDRAANETISDSAFDQLMGGD